MGCSNGTPMSLSETFCLSWNHPVVHLFLFYMLLVKEVADTNMLWELYSKQPFVPDFDQRDSWEGNYGRGRRNDSCLIALEYCGSGSAKSVSTPPGYGQSPFCPLAWLFTLIFRQACVLKWLHLPETPGTIGAKYVVAECCANDYGGLSSECLYRFCNDHYASKSTKTSVKKRFEMKLLIIISFIITYYYEFKMNIIAKKKGIKVFMGGKHCPNRKGHSTVRYSENGLSEGKIWIGLVRSGVHFLHTLLSCSVGWRRFQ